MRKSNPAAKPTVKLSVEIDRTTHAKIRWLATSRGVLAGDLVAGFLRHAVRGVSCRDGTEGTDPAEPSS